VRAPVTIFLVSSIWNFVLVCYFTWYEQTEPNPFIPEVTNGRIIARGSPRQVLGPYGRAYEPTGHLRDGAYGRAPPHTPHAPPPVLRRARSTPRRPRFALGRTRFALRRARFALRRTRFALRRTRFALKRPRFALRRALPVPR